MAEVINLRQARKHKQRGEKEKQAEVNRQKFGRSKAEKQQTTAEAALSTRKLDGHKLDKP
jgi:hypothetical protein